MSATIVNPVRGMYLNGRYYSYVSDSWHEESAFKNSSTEAQNARVFNGALGLAPEVFTVSFLLENTYTQIEGTSIVGTTNWLGVSRLADLKSFLDVNGASMPISYVPPYGVTYLVVPTGRLGVDIFNQSNPDQAGTEFRVSLTLESTT